jgi:peptide deformylase
VTVREVRRLPDPLLKEQAREVGARDVDELVRDLVETMRASPACVGLAAPQIGILERVVVVDVSRHPKTTVTHGLVALIDPVVVESSGRETGREGCMSVPDLTANVARATKLVVAGRAPDAAEQVIVTEGFEARALQHEIDHLDGYLVLDRVSSLATDVFRRRVYK